MITINSIKIKSLNQKTYHSFLESIELHSISCTCGHSGCLIKHGFYKRSIKSFNDNKVILSILRVKCNICGKTHAIFPILIVPYSQITLDDHICIINNHNTGKSHETLMTKKILIDENSIRRILFHYKRYWQQRLISAFIPLSLHLADLSKNCIEIFKRQFMQIKFTQNIFISFNHIT